MGTQAEEPRKILRAIRFTEREDDLIRLMMREEEYLSISKYIRDKALARTVRRERSNISIMLQKVEIIGKVVADAELKQSKNGNQYVSFTVVVTEKMGDEKKSTFYDVGYGRTGILNYVKTGRVIYVSGRLSLSSICKDGNAYLNAYVSASEVDLIGKE